MYTLGFTTTYYTLWFVDEPTEKLNVYCSSKQIVQTCSYIQNLSTDYNKAIAKIHEKSNGQYKIDLDLKGHSSFDRIISERSIFENWQFSFGMLAGMDIRACDDVWQLNRALSKEDNKRRRVYARCRLIELGELVRNTFANPGEDKYISPAHFKYLQEKRDQVQASGHYWTKGEKVTITLKRTGGVAYQTQYGKCWIDFYITDDGKVVKYKGSTPPDINEDFVTVSGTVEHSEYKGLPETRLKRIKILK